MVTAGEVVEILIAAIFARKIFSWTGTQESFPPNGISQANWEQSAVTTATPGDSSINHRLWRMWALPNSKGSL